MSEGASLKSFKSRQQSQLNDRSMDAFYPVSDYVIDRSRDAYKATYRSIGFQSFIFRLSAPRRARNLFACSGTRHGFFWTVSTAAHQSDLRKHSTM